MNPELLRASRWALHSGVLFGLGALSSLFADELLYGLIASIHAGGLVVLAIATRRMGKDEQAGPSAALKALVAVLVIRAVWYGTTAGIMILTTGLMGSFALTML